ncbi:uncharacterized protein C7orf57-like [Acanthaster planci]|uniref:Uncharacterized protein C7orf57-like n=1 Tax=Acanthaster planci TaxID=133434 RepID=A0A8B8A4N5_ACAPL|nr:uncharacterized protein C7orf57-like [Acanthaster planci]
MAGKSGTQDWFYHAPKKRSPDAGPKDYPAPSQIPMLSNAVIEEDARDETGMMRGWIRESDSKYVRLAKQRGRRDLLQIRERPPPSKEAKPYPRVDWFDHNPEPEAQDEKSVRKVYLPDYMVHEEYNPETHVDEQEGKRPPPRRPPYSLQDKLSVFEREGGCVTDKMHVKLPEIKATGKKVTKKDKGRKDEGKTKLQNRYAKVPTHETQEKPIMEKLLNFGYQHEWYDQREKYYEHQKKVQSNQPSWDHSASQGSRLTTEYRDEINTGNKESKGPGSPRSKRVAMTKKAEAMRKDKQEATEKELFKLSKFDKVGPRINSHWSDGPRLTDQEKMDTYTRQLEEMTHA